MTIKGAHLWRRFCWKRLRKAVMVVHPQEVPSFGVFEFGDRGYGECTACGGRHLILEFGRKGYIK